MPLPPFPVLPAPRTWGASGPEPVLVPELRTDVDNAITFLTNRPMCLAYDTTAQAVTSGTDFLLQLTSEQVDNWGGHSVSTESFWYYCQVPGWYLATTFAPFNYTSSTVNLFTASVGVGLASGVTVRQGEQTYWGVSGATPCLTACDLVQLTRTGPPGTAGVDYIAIYARQGTGSNVNILNNTGNVPYMYVRWVAASSGTTGLVVPANATWPSPPSYVTSAFLNSNIRDTIRFLTYPPIFRGYYAGSGNTVPNQTWPAATVIKLDTTSGAGTTAGGLPVDNYSGWNSGSSYWAAPVAGLYTVFGQVALAGSSNAGHTGAGLSVNGGTVQWGKGHYSPNHTSPVGDIVFRRLRLNAGDQVQLMASNNISATLNVTGSGSSECFTKLVIVWEGA